MKYKKLLNIVEKYINNDINVEVTNDFCDDYMEEFYNIQDDLEKEVQQYIYELFDDINLACDSYEPNVEIRVNDDYCVNEILLRKKVLEIYKKIVE